VPSPRSTPLPQRFDFLPGSRVTHHRFRDRATRERKALRNPNPRGERKWRRQFETKPWPAAELNHGSEAGQAEEIGRSK
jgi:hypothetical protein